MSKMYKNIKTGQVGTVILGGYCTCSGQALGQDVLPTYSTGFNSIEYTGTGLFRVNLRDKYEDLLWADGTVDRSGEGEEITTPFLLSVYNEDVGGTAGTNSGNGTVTFACTVSGSHAEPNRSKVHFCLMLGNSKHSVE